MTRLFNILVLVTLVGIVGCESREQARRKQVANNLKQLCLALEAYHGKAAGPDVKKESATIEESPATVAPKTEGKGLCIFYFRELASEFK